MCAEVVHAIDAQHDVVGSSRWTPRLNCCTIGFCSRLSMMLMPDAPAPGRMNPVNGFAVDGANGGNWPGRGIEKEDVARAHLDRQRPTIEAAFERLDLERDAVVIDAVAAVHARPGAAGGPVETDARSEIVHDRASARRRETAERSG